uniref:Centrosomal protein 128 n=1 Tax=Neogobius melanostomus TaxID=47308 RepID=A0A8C6U802_9GOBI
MDTSSESDTFDRPRGHRARGREAHRRQTRDRDRARDAPTTDISAKISTLANTLQSTSKNLNKVDRMLGHYREHSDEQAETMALLRENLEDSINQLQSQRTGRRDGTKSASVSASPLHTSDLDVYSESGTVHTLHQSLRDLRSDQHRLTDDLDREILRRNRYRLKPIYETVTVALFYFYPDNNVFKLQSSPKLSPLNIILEPCADRSDLEKEVADLKEQLRRASVMGEVEELKRALAQDEKEKVQLSLQVQVCSVSFIIIRSEKRQLEVMLEESRRSREELKTRAQEAIRQWRAKCRRLQKELEEVNGAGALSQQTEAARRELAEILGRLAHREEELRRKDVELSDSRHRQLSLEQEAREAYTSLEHEVRNQAAIHTRLKEENQRLEERADSQARRRQKDEDQHVELQQTVKQVTVSHAQLVQRLAEEEGLRKELHKSHSELQARLTAVQEERAALGQQLQLQREVHRNELDNIKAALEDGKSKKERDLQDMLKIFTQERDELQEHLKDVKADAASDKELCEALRIKLDRMKDECDKLAAQLGSKEDAHSLLQRKYQLLREELDDKVSPKITIDIKQWNKSNERRRTSESEVFLLKEKVSKMEADQEAVLTAMGEELDSACLFSLVSEDPSAAIFDLLSVFFPFFPSQSKVRWLCEEVRERNKREQSQRRQHQQTKDQLKALRQSREQEQADFLQRLDQQEKLLHSLGNEKQGLLERSRNKEDEMRSLQVGISLTRAALDRLEAIPERPSLLDNFKDLEESQRQREVVEQRYSKYKEIVWDLQHQLDESKRRIQEYRVNTLNTIISLGSVKTPLFTKQQEAAIPDSLHIYLFRSKVLAADLVQSITQWT